jgi:lipoprotein NlpD
MKRLAAIALSGLAACISLTNYQPRSYVVGSGDTLYSIAWSHGVDHRNLARWNNLSNPDRIYVGQRLALGPQGRTASASASGSGSAPNANRSAPLPGRSAPLPGQSVPAPNRTAQLPGRAPPPAANTAIPGFAWPTRGTIVARFGERGILQTGIGISGRVGQDVLAAAAGEVVYVGSGLPQYGQVVIIKHSEAWLTAYGHNQRLLVTQSQTVARGQKIGEMGLGPGSQPRLYFEIRRNGDPLDPLDLLPGAG